MQVRNRFEVPMAPAHAWPFLMNIPSTVPCFPGAEMVEKIDEDHYKGRITVKLGPLNMVFLGTLHIEDRDETARSATVKANWTETKGRGNAVTVTRFVMQPHGEGTLIGLDSDVQLAGQVAQYGRGAGMISDISAQLISKFAANLQASIKAAAPEVSEIPAHAHEDASRGVAAPPSQPVHDSAPLPHQDISVLGLLWSSVLSRFKRLFS